MHIIYDHKLIGEKYKLFFFDKDIPGQVLILPKGHIMFTMLENIIRKQMIKDNYQEIRSGSFGSKRIWEQTQHINKYAENLFYIDNNILKPMNCPMHMILAKKIYKIASNLPIKLFEFNYCYRNEKSGSICGMFRLNRFTQDDAHIIQKTKDIGSIIANFIDNVKAIYDLFNINDIEFRLSIIDQKNYIGTNEQRIIAQELLRTALNAYNIKYTEEANGAFYAPKIDIIIHDSQNRKWQTGTIQADMCLLTNSNFTMQNNDKIEDICVIHQAILGTFERFIAIMLEHHGKAPPIINPYQIAILFIKNIKNNKLIYTHITANIINIPYNTIDIIEGKHINEKIIKSRELNYEYQIIIGPKEVENKIFNIQNNKTKDIKSYSFKEKIILDF